MTANKKMEEKKALDIPKWQDIWGSSLSGKQLSFIEYFVQEDLPFCSQSA